MEQQIDCNRNNRNFIDILLSSVCTNLYVTIRKRPGRNVGRDACNSCGISCLNKIVKS
ncbi:hypothetical protein K0M31_005575 [Melipona bicolor]|uniref:Uncharacterized protein n=1 Tax=Melipona bicolor TaxID=60889 RepID=A0AA40KMN1_9HYME|nr:hypothetical protein K0M31_005575 [Melipona bicolor]